MNKRLSALLIAVVALTILSGIPALAAPAAGLSTPEVRASQAENGGLVEISGSQVLAVNLDSNPSTGYGWYVLSMDKNILRQVGEEWIPGSGLLGAPGTAVLRFAGVNEGQTTLQLAYQRPWDKGVEAINTYSIQVQVKAPAYVEGAAPKVEPAASVDNGTNVLPTSYNWCSQGKCTAVRDQGNCGSCWAFGTVGPLESAILINNETAQDLSEQYLVSCNTEGWGCNGGWWAHDYHEWKIPPGENAAGAVRESAFRYTATDAPCAGPYTHYETLTNWAYVGGSSSVPTTDAIKNAIYTHGPVSAAVCVDNAFQSYTGGVFAGSKGCRSVNHAIVLVGWSDADGAWILRNSWDSNWGENGYMRIKYGGSQVGYAASYVEYGGATPPPPPPSGTMHVSAIDMWYTVSGVFRYVYTKVTIVDANNAPVSGATVSIQMTLPGGGLATGSAATGTDGTATFSIKNKKTGTYTSAVTNVTHASYTYDPNANVITQRSLVVQ